jgi:ATP-dependent helicase HrpB
VDVRTRLEIMAQPADRVAAHAAVDRSGWRRALRAAEALARQQRTPWRATDIQPNAAGTLLALAYPDRVARWRDERAGRYQLRGGRGAVFAEPQALAGSEFLVIPELDAGDREARIQLAAPLSRADIELCCADGLRRQDVILWDSREQAVSARRELRLGEIRLSEEKLLAPDADALLAAMLAGIRELGLAALPWTDELRQWQARVHWRRHAYPEHTDWPDVSDAALLAQLAEWLSPWLAGISRRSHLAKLDLHGALTGRLSFAQQRQLEADVPTHLTVPSGSRIPIDYLGAAEPTLSARLQEVFGLSDTPSLCGGRVQVLLHLLSPARRPVQVTRDLRSFWNEGYHAVKKELKGRYPRHYWPDDP